MAIYHCQINNKNRDNGAGNICAIVAYRTGEKLHSLDDNKIKEPHRKRGISGIEAIGLINWTRSRQELWNEVERLDNRKNSRFCKEVMIAIPKELSMPGQRLELVNDIADQITERYESAVDFAIHKPDKGNDNYHAHILFTLRGSNGKKLSKKKNRKLTEWKEMYWIRRDLYEKAVNIKLAQYGHLGCICGRPTDNPVKSIHHGNRSNLQAKNKAIQPKRIKKQNEINRRHKVITIGEKTSEVEQKQRTTASKTRYIERRVKSLRSRRRTAGGFRKGISSIKRRITKYKNWTKRIYKKITEVTAQETKMREKARASILEFQKFQREHEKRERRLGNIQNKLRQTKANTP